MENASKALLIAGGVLIAILVASLGVYFSRNIADFTSKTYKQLEEHERTEFNQQFLNYNGKNDLTIQDIVTIVNLAKDSNKNNGLEDIDATNDYSLYVTVVFDNSSYNLGELSINAYSNLEKLSNENINKLIKNEMTKTEIANFSCEVSINNNTGYVNYIRVY